MRWKSSEVKGFITIKTLFSFHPFEGRVRRVCIWRTKALRTGCFSTDVGSKTQKELSHDTRYDFTPTRMVV